MAKQASISTIVYTTLNTIYKDYLNKAHVEVEVKDADGNTLSVRNDAKLRLRYSLKNECDLFWRQCYGNVSNPEVPAQYSAKQGVEYWQDAVNKSLDRLARSGKEMDEDDRLQRQVEQLEAAVLYFNLMRGRFEAAKDFYESVLEEGYTYEVYNTKQSPTARVEKATKSELSSTIARLLRKNERGDLDEITEETEAASVGGTEVATPWTHKDAAVG